MSNTLMTGVSGVRGIVGTDLTPEVVARYAAAFGHMVVGAPGSTVVLARDSRASGPAFAAAARAGLAVTGARVIDCGIVPTPTAQLAVTYHGARGGIVITASHNPVEWNALKFVGSDGIFLDAAQVERLLEIERSDELPTISLDGAGEVTSDSEAGRRHVERVLALDVIDSAAVSRAGLTVALDCVRGAGGEVMRGLLEALGCKVVGIDLEPDGRFPRSPEPVQENLGRLRQLVLEMGADLGMAVDPDADRLALVDEAGAPIGEDYTLAFAVRAVLQRTVGPVVANLSTSLVVDDAARRFGVEVQRVPVGEVNVARAMERAGAVVGGEGNGGVMLAELHLGRDAPLAAALVLDVLAREGTTVGGVVADGPRYVVVKAKAPRRGGLAEVFRRLENRFADAELNRQDGLRLGWSDRWLHVRPSNTEPIVRLIAEAPSGEAAESLVAAAREEMAA